VSQTSRSKSEFTKRFRQFHSRLSGIAEPAATGPADTVALRWRIRTELRHSPRAARKSEAPVGG